MRDPEEQSASAESVNPAIASFDELDAEASVILVNVAIPWHGWSTEVVGWRKELHRGAILDDEFIATANLPVILVVGTFGN